MRVRRYDTLRLDAVRRTDAGYLEAPAFLTRTGVFEYTRADGTIQRELRLPEEVFAERALSSLDLAPLTRGHPIGGRVDAGNVRDLQVGIVANPVKAEDGQHIAARVRIQDAETVRAVEAGERELSCGYDCTLEPIPGGVFKHADGREDHADFVQRGILNNHVATTPRGRAGPTASIRLDSAGNALAAQETSNMDAKDLEKRLDEQAKQIAELTKLAADAAKLRTDSAAELDKVRGENAALKARIDETEKAAAAETKRKADEAHASLCQQVSPVVGKPASELLKLDSVAVKSLVLAQKAPNLRLDGQTPAFIDAAFQTLLATRTDSADLAALAALGANTHAARNDGDIQKRIDSARQKNRELSEGAWKRNSI